MSMIEMPTRSLPTRPARRSSTPELWGDMDAWHARARRCVRPNRCCRSRSTATTRSGCSPDTPTSSRSSETTHAGRTRRSRSSPRRLCESRASIGIQAGTLVHLDGDEHRAHRHVVNDWFKPAVVARRQGRVDGLADEYVDKIRGLGGACDFAVDIAVPYTLRVIMDIYGVPEADEPMMLELTQGIFGATDPEFMGEATDPLMRAAESAFQFAGYFDELPADRQACPRDDLASIIANGAIDGRELGADERFFLYLIIATAGHDTTSFALSGGMEAMLRDPDQLWALREDPDLVNNAAEEIIRWTAPVRHFLRTATDDSEVRGVPIPAGGRVLLSYPVRQP